MGGSPVNSSDMARHYRSRDYYGASSYYSSGRSIDVTPRRRITDASEVFKSTNMIDEFNPAKMKLPREACDSAQSPHSKGIILQNDGTGSMGRYSLSLIQKQFPKLIEKIYSTVPWNPHIMCACVGDVAAGDRAPFQATQFETDLRILEQLEKIWLEGYGGGNGSESYILGWYFAGKYCKMDCFEKRGEKGFMFSFGDEGPTPKITPSELKTVFGERQGLSKRTLSATDCLEIASEKFNCYHIILHGSGYSRYSWIVDDWKELMGGHACDLSDYDCLPELVCTILKMYEGASKTEAINDIEDYHTKRVVSEALCDHEENVVDEKVEADGNGSDFEIL